VWNAKGAAAQSGQQFHPAVALAAPFTVNSKKPVVTLERHNIIDPSLPIIDDPTDRRPRLRQFSFRAGRP